MSTRGTFAIGSTTPAPRSPWGSSRYDRDRQDRVEIRLARFPEALQGLHPDPGLGAFFHYISAAAPRTFKTIAYTLEHGGMAYLACLGDAIVGYLAIARPGIDQPWGCDRDLPVREVNVEVAREWRRQGLAHRLFAALITDTNVEDQILVATAYRWCWDVDDATAGWPDSWTYSHGLFGLFASAGFSRRATSEPNIVMDPRNFLAVRVGARVPAGQTRRFEASLFPATAARQNA